MSSPISDIVQAGKYQQSVPAVSAVFRNGAILEMVYRPQERQTEFVLSRDGQWTYQKAVSIDPAVRFVPYSPHNNLIKNEVVLLPSAPEEYGSEEKLLAAIQQFIHRYVDISPFFEQIALFVRATNFGLNDFYPDRVVLDVALYHKSNVIENALKAGLSETEKRARHSAYLKSIPY